MRPLFFSTSNRILESMPEGVNPTVVILTQQSAVLCTVLALTLSGESELSHDCC